MTRRGAHALIQTLIAIKQARPIEAILRVLENG